MTIRQAQRREQKATVACVAVYKESNENVQSLNPMMESHCKPHIKTDSARSVLY